MRLLIDLQGAQNGSRFRGIGRYINGLLRSMLDSCWDEHEVLILLNGALAEGEAAVRADWRGLISDANIKTWYPCPPVSWGHPGNDLRRMASEKIREAAIALLAPDVVLISSLFEGAGDDVVTSIGTFVYDIPTVVIFYDLIPYLYPDQYLGNSRLKNWYYDKLKQLSRSDLLLSISEASRQEAVHHLNFPTDCVVNISTGIDAGAFRRQELDWDKLAARYSINRPYILYSGASDPRKNLARLVEAFASIPPDIVTRFQLVLAGETTAKARKSLNSIARKLPRGKHQLVFTGYVSDAELAALYRKALGFVFPSIHEGFGLPPLEAIVCGTPAIGSNTSVIPEVIGVQEALIDPLSVSSIAVKMERLMTDASFREYLRHAQAPQLAKFNWKSVAERTWVELTRLYARSQEPIPMHRPRPAEIFDRLILDIGKLLGQCGATSEEYSAVAEAIHLTFQQQGI